MLNLGKIIRNKFYQYYQHLILVIYANVHFRPEFKSTNLETIHELLIEKISSWYEIKLIITRKQESNYFKLAEIESI